jgi:hypothetical protein
MAEQSVDRPRQQGEVAHLPPSAPPTNHGHTVAAWTTVVIVLVGSLVACVGVLVAIVWMFWAGLAVVLIGVIVGRVLKGMGYGQGGARTAERQAGSAHH